MKWMALTLIAFGIADYPNPPKVSKVKRYFKIDSIESVNTSNERLEFYDSHGDWFIPYKNYKEVINKKYIKKNRSNEVVVEYCNFKYNSMNYSYYGTCKELVNKLNHPYRYRFQ